MQAGQRTPTQQDYETKAQQPARLRRSDLVVLPTIETHISSVFLAEDQVFKLKKSVDLGFLDFTSLQKRRDAVLAEVILNQRLAPDVYLGAVPVLDQHDRIIDWAVRMRRLEERFRADRLLVARRLDASRVHGIAERLAAFHASARCDRETAAYGRVLAIESNVTENFDQTEEVLSLYLNEDERQEIENWQLRFLADNAGLFQGRIDQQRIRDGHGDLRLEHIYFCPTAAEPPAPRGLQIIDCIEFNDRFRYADVAADLAFLAMDLTWFGEPLLAEALLSAYARASNDYGLYEVIDFYESYRAFVRGKVCTFVAADAASAPAARERARREARRYFRLALASERRSLQRPMVVAVGGLVASGKTTIANRLGRDFGAAVLSSDLTRKHLAGVGPRDSLNSGRPFTAQYSDSSTRRVYRELARRARSVLRSGRPVVVDASFRSAETREMFRGLARSEGVDFRWVQCTAPREVLLARLQAREGRSLETDARADLLTEFENRWEPATEIAPDEGLWVDSSQSLDTLVERLASALQVVPRDLSA